MVVGRLVFVAVPLLALCFFILFSAYHFGEQHWDAKGTINGLMQKLLFFSYGLVVLFLLFFLNPVETESVIYEITGFVVAPDSFLVGLITSGVIWFVLMEYMAIGSKLNSKSILFEVFLLLVFAIVFETASLLWAFAIYFIFWHSIPSILEQMSYLYGSTNLTSMKKYLKTSGPIWFISMIGLLFLYYLLKDNGTLFKPLFFVFLGSITFAHSFVISWVFKSKQ